MFAAEYENVRRMMGIGDVDVVLAQEVAVIYKHSPACGLSGMAAEQVEAFLRSGVGIPVYVVDVIAERPVSAEIARRLEVRHESPQVILVRSGEAVWDASHRAVTEEALARQVGELV